MIPIANPYHHAVSSAKKWGGRPENYLDIHRWFDESKAHHADFRHRALRHHTEGIFLMEKIFGVTLRLSTCQRCGKSVNEGAHYVAIANLEIEFMEGDGKDEELASRILGLRAVQHAFAPKMIPTRWVGEQHVLEDLGFIPPATAWLKQIKSEEWMQRSRKLSIELEGEDVQKAEAEEARQVS